MSFSPSDSQILGPLFADDDLVELFSDRGFVSYMVAVEVALARVQGRLGVIPQPAAQEIESAISTAGDQRALDFSALRQATQFDGFPVIELLRQLRGRLGEDAASCLHWGATTQDVIDTATVLQLRAALARIEPKLTDLIAKLARLADEHRATLMAGRTHSQQALPVTFGLKVAGWLAPLLRQRQRLSELEPRLLVLQFGGAAGTLAALQGAGMDVRRELAKELGLGLPLLPWHTQRDNLAEFAGWLSLLSGSLAKMAQDVILLAQSEVAEVRESSDVTRGGSSTMPQKSNPIHSELIVAAARSNASLLSSMHNALVQEHERATHAWQLEWMSLPLMIAQTSSALAKALWLSENLWVDVERMKVNVEASQGLMLAEAAVFELSRFMSRADAKALVGEAARVARDERRNLIELLRESVEVELDWDVLDERNYLGSAEAFIDAVLTAARSSGRQPGEAGVVE